jgi:hypothetical protein
MNSLWESFPNILRTKIPPEPDSGSGRCAQVKLQQLARKGRGLAAAMMERPAHHDPVAPPAEAVQRWTARIAEIFEGSLPSPAVRPLRPPGGPRPGGSERRVLAPHRARLPTEAAPPSLPPAPPPPS